jgi:rhodanese-related sulfurtransferase
MTEDLYANMEVAPGEVKDMLARGEKLLFVDVREKWEYDTTHIEGSVLIPLREIPANLARLEAASELVLFCHHGMRSFGCRSVVALARRGRRAVDGRRN